MKTLIEINNLLEVFIKKIEQMSFDFAPHHFQGDIDHEMVLFLHEKWVEIKSNDPKSTAEKALENGNSRVVSYHSMQMVLSACYNFNCHSFVQSKWEFN